MDIIFNKDAGPLLEGIINRAISGCLQYFNYHGNVEVSISIVDSNEIRGLNNEYRNIDAVTDVLSFPLLQPGEIAQAFSGGGQVFLGDIVICMERAELQAKEYNHPLKREIAFLTVHSMLHLLGYDHSNSEEEKGMFGVQEEILKNTGYTREEI
ncbi:MAG: rRNA maturation RNase YbeY [Clostridiales bacterium]|jgi:probable rRNA maturation factor|nr:rRNA maturation RNase YbeY [Clostridiales bacterium]